MLFTQILFALILLPLISGPFAVYATYGGPNLIVISAWLFVWMTDRYNSLRWAVIMGLLLDFVSFLPFGFWTLVLITLVYGVDFLKMRYSESSSILQALFVLFVALVAEQGLFYAITYQTNGYYFVLSIISSLLLGSIMYYLLAIKMRLFSRWAGFRLS